MYVVYKIKNNINNKIYVGSSKEFYKRKLRHIYQLRNNFHHCLYLQRFVNKYGIDAISFEIIESFDSLDEMLQKEQELLCSELDLFNVSKTATGGDLLTNHPDRINIIKKITNSIRSRYLLEENKRKCAKYGIFNPNYKGGAYKRCLDCDSLILKANTRCMQCSKNGANNPFFGKSHSDETKIRFKQRMMGVKPTNSQKVIVDNIEYLSYTEAARSLGCAVATIINRCKSDKFPNYVKKV